jgi:hemolysin activation/secretion protein
MKSMLLAVASGLVLSSVAVCSSHAQAPIFPIRGFEVSGNVRVSTADIEKALAPFVGPERRFDDVTKARAAIERLYGERGLEFVQAVVAQQEIKDGLIRVQIVEGVLRNVVVKGNQYFDTPNVLAALPTLKTGAMPNLGAVSANTQLSNENSAKQVHVALASLGSSGELEAVVDVADSNPQRIFFTVDNTGTRGTGRYRTGVAYQNANLFNRDHQASIAYTTSPDSPSGVHVNLYSVGYRIPFYDFGDSLEVLYGKSSVNTPSASPTLGGVLGITGKGNVAALHYNHPLERVGERSAKLVVGIEDRYIDSRCRTADGIELSIAPPTPPVSGCVPYRTRPVSVSYSGQIQRPGAVIDYIAGYEYNLASGSVYTSADGRSDRYSYLTPGSRPTRDHFQVVRLGATYFAALPADWQIRVASSGQYSADPLLASEQFSLAGATAVRGLDERAVTADYGVLVNAELYTPELAARNGVPGELRLLAFSDLGKGFNRRTGGTSIPDAVFTSSLGAGIRYAFGRQVTLRLDAARVGRSGLPAGTGAGNGDWRVQFNLVFGS